MISYSIYLHIPFCQHRCGYCDFNTYAGLENLIPAYTTALCSEIESIRKRADERLEVHTIFFGGGTPSLLPADAYKRILEYLDIHFRISPQAEISLEANPGTLSLSYLENLRNLGFNRLSLGMQSASPEELNLLERIHDYPQVIQAFMWARKAGFNNVNLDLIFGLPEQSMQSWQRNLELALGLKPEHFALYALTLEHGTPFGAWAKRGLLAIPDSDLGADMYEWASERLTKDGYAQYEISNWAHSSNPQYPFALTCRHNLQYWRNQPYLGLGSGAHGFADGIRTVNVRSPKVYIQRLKNQSAAGVNQNSFPVTPATQEIHRIDRQTEIGETMMMGLRLTQEGISASSFKKRFGEELNDIFGPQIERLLHAGLLEWVGNQEQILRLTQQGRLLGNQVFVEFI